MVRLAFLFAVLPVIVVAQNAPSAWVLNPRGLETAIFTDAGENGAYNIRACADGGYIVAGSARTARGDLDLLVLKLREDLSPDPAFGKNGRWIAGSGGEDQAIDVIEVRDTAGKPDGFIVVGYARKGDCDFAGLGHHGKIDIVVARLTQSGVLDARFGKGGLRLYGGSGDDEVLVHLNNYSEPGERIVQAADGGFVIAGMTRSTDGDLEGIATIGHAQARDTMIFKINARGDYAADFGDRGILRIGTALEGKSGKREPTDYVFSIKPDPTPADGFIVAGFHLGASITIDGATIKSAGNTVTSARYKNKSDESKHQMDGWLIRLDARGKLRGDWAGRGVRFVGGSRQEKMYDVALAPAVSGSASGGWLMTGRTASCDLDFERPETAPDDFDMVLVKIASDGKLDRSFGVNGAVFSGDDSSGQGVRVLVSRDGGEISWLGQTQARPAEIAAQMPQGSSWQVVLLRLSKDGVILNRWSLGGVGEEKPSGMCIDAKGRVLIAGFVDRDAVEIEENGKDRDGSKRQLLVMRLGAETFVREARQN